MEMGSFICARRSESWRSFTHGFRGWIGAKSFHGSVLLKTSRALMVRELVFMGFSILAFHSINASWNRSFEESHVSQRHEQRFSLTFEETKRRMVRRVVLTTWDVQYFFGKK